MNEVRQSSAKIFISSANKTQWASTTNNSSVEVRVTPFVLRANDNTHFVIGIESLSVPLSIYNINSNNNELQIITSPATVDNYVIPSGNYTVSALITYLNTLGGVTYTLDTTTNKITTQYGLDFKAFSGTLSSVLGFVSDATTLYATNYTFTNTVNLAYTTGILVRLDNIQTDNRDSTTGTSSIIGRIPITVAPFKVLQYFNGTPFYTTISNRYIQSIKVSLLDDLYRPLELVGNPTWFIVLRVDYADKLNTIREKELLTQISQSALVGGAKPPLTPPTEGVRGTKPPSTPPPRPLQPK